MKNIFGEPISPEHEAEIFAQREEVRYERYVERQLTCKHEHSFLIPVGKYKARKCPDCGFIKFDSALALASNSTPEVGQTPTT